MEMYSELFTEVWVPADHPLCSAASTKSSSSSSSSSSVQVDLKISWEVEHQWINVAPNGVPYMIENSVVQNLDKQLQVTNYQLLTSVTACQLRLYWVLFEMGIYPIFYFSIATKIVEQVREYQILLSQMAAAGVTLPLRVRIRLLTTHLRYEQALIDLAVTESMEQNGGEEGNYMIPATDVSMRELKTATISESESGETESCMVCLEELCGGSEATVMPCSHVFHGSCIIRWLKQSHVCPICRFQMPTNSN